MKSIPFEQRVRTLENRIKQIADNRRRTTLKKNYNRIISKVRNITGQSSNKQRVNSLKKLRSNTTLTTFDNKPLVNSILPESIVNQL